MEPPKTGSEECYHSHGNAVYHRLPLPDTDQLFKLFDQNLALTNGEPSKMSEMLALNIFTTFYGRAGYEGVGQAKAVIFILAAAIALTQNYLTRRKEVQQ